MSEINSIICIDIESGGLNPKKNPITQIAYQAFQLCNYKAILEYSTYIQPYNELVLEDAAMKYTGITYNQLMSGLDTKEVVKKMCEDFSAANTANTHTKKPILMGHNIGFDIGFICYLFNYEKVDITKYLDCNHDIPKSIDTLLLAKQKWGNLPKGTKFTLGACTERAGIALHDAHDALNDVRATKELFIYFTNTLRSGSSVATAESTKETRVRNHWRF